MTAEYHPSFCVVVATHQREALAAKCCRSVREAIDAYEGSASLVVVNSSAEPLFDDPGEATREIHVPDLPGAAAKRNRGLRAASAEWVVFVDDDCVIDAESLSVLAGEIRRRDDDDLAGIYPVTEFAGSRTRAFRACEDTRFTSVFTLPARAESVPFGALTLAAFDREKLTAVGGFDSSFTAGAGGEDVDLGTRLREAGGRLVGVSDPLVRHTTATWNSVTGNARRFYAYGLGETDLQVRHGSKRVPRLDSPLALGAVLAAGSLAAGALSGPLLGAAVAPIYLLVHTLVAVSGSVLRGKTPAEALVYRLYGYAYGAGRLRRALAAGRPDAALYQFTPYADPDSITGRGTLVIRDEYSHLFAVGVALVGTLLLAVA
ncbi:glycosyltransferase family 2 protein [Halosimplex marinum]|uniref:glycosyltransferase family 2 protein n=1 Tax=Halosimplex marinum TaxID=3396620 RepID=UPI003F55E4F9